MNALDVGLKWLGSHFHVLCVVPHTHVKELLLVNYVPALPSAFVLCLLVLTSDSALGQCFLDSLGILV